MQPIDLRVYKKNLRNEKRAARLALTPEVKAELDSGVAKNVRRLNEYKSVSTLLVYVSTDIEVSTRQIIENAWADGKRVAVPRCVPNTREMEFFYIDSFDCLETGSFSLQEPKPTLPKFENTADCLMLVPAFTLDRNGYRLGYGMGYYDRFIAKFLGKTAGICYSQDICSNMLHGRYDRSVNVIVTEKYIRTIVRHKKFFEK